MKLSILIVTYNQENYIKDCLDSVLMQRFNSDYELIIADDVSTDSTLEIIRDTLSNVDAPYRILNRGKNLGISKNYQDGFSECNGKYIAVLEGDDYWTDPNRLQYHVDFLESHRECVISFNRFIRYFQENWKFKVDKWPHGEDFEYISTSQLALGNCIGTLSACVFRKSAIDKLPSEVFNLGIADWMLGMTLGQFGLLAKHRKPMSVYRIHADGVWSRKKGKEKRKGTLKKIEIYNEFLQYKYNKEFRINKIRTYLQNWGCPTIIIKTIMWFILKKYRMLP